MNVAPCRETTSHMLLEVNLQFPVITKSAFIQFLDCRNAFWLMHHHPLLVVQPEESSHTAQQGIEFEALVRTQFPTGRSVRGAIEELESATTEAIGSDASVLFQAFAEADGFSARADLLIRLNDGTWELREVKAANSGNEDGASNKKQEQEYLDDLTFQFLVFKAAGIPISSCSFARLNSKYVRGSALEPSRLIYVEDAMERVLSNVDHVQAAMEDAKATLQSSSLPVQHIADLMCDRTECACRAVSYKDVPEYSVFNLRNARRSNINKLLRNGLVELRQLTVADLGESKFQAQQLLVAQSGSPHIDRQAIREILGSLRYPLYFLDYESCNFAIPRYPGFRPWDQVTNQFSLHVLDAPDRPLRHFEFLSLEDADCSLDLATALQQCIPSDDGSIVVWNATFERGRNTQMGTQLPACRSFFEDLNFRMSDLMTVFSAGHYIDERFHGKTSLKKVLPVLCPHLSYQALDVQHGQMAVERWVEAAVRGVSVEEKERTRRALLEYCKLDTLAMVELLRAIFTVLGQSALHGTAT